MKGIKMAALVFVVGVIGTAVCFVQEGFSFGNTVPIDETKTIDAAGIQNITFNSSISSAHIYPGNSNQIKVHLYGKTSKDNLQFLAQKNGDTADIELQRPFELMMFGFGNGLNADVEVPAQMYKHFQVKLSAGSVQVEKLRANQFDIRDSAGGIDIQDLTGDVLANDSAGGMDITNVNGKLDLSDSAGSITVHLPQINHDITATDSAGSVNVFTVAEPQALQFQASTSAGHATVQLPNANFTQQERSNVAGTIGNGGPIVTLRSSAGSVYLGQGSL